MHAGRFCFQSRSRFWQYDGPYSFRANKSRSRAAVATTLPKTKYPESESPSLFSLHSFVQSLQYNNMSPMCVPPSVTPCSCRVHRIAYISPPLLFSSLSDDPDPLTRRTAAQASAAVAIRAYLAFDMLKTHVLTPLQLPMQTWGYGIVHQDLKYVAPPLHHSPSRSSERSLDLTYGL